MGEEYGTHPAGEVYVDVDGMRAYIKAMVGTAQVVHEIHDYLDGENKEYQTVQLTKEDFGGHQPFVTQYYKIVNDRLDEVDFLDQLLWRTARKLAWGMSKLVGTDVELAAKFPSAEGPSLKTRVGKHGMHLDPGDSRGIAYGYHDEPPPSNEEDARVRRDVERQMRH